MSNTTATTYTIQGKSNNVSETQEIVLPGENQFSRRIIQVQLINHHENPSKFAGLHLDLIYQKRKTATQKWPSVYLDLRSPELVGKNIRIRLDTEQTEELFKVLFDNYLIAKESIASGSRVVLRDTTPDQIIISDKNRVAIFKKLLQSSTEEEIWDLLRNDLPKLSSKLALSKIYDDRLKIIQEFESSIELGKGEEYWQQFLTQNKWIFGTSYIQIIGERRIDIHHQSDFPFEAEDGFMDLAEIKKPELPFWTKDKSGNHYLYRGKFLIPHSELQGAIAQCSKYILQAEKNVNNVDYIKDHGGVIPLKPKCLIVHGRSAEWKETESEAFRLLNDSHHGIGIITFDHLLRRAKGILEVMREESKK